MYSKIEMFLCNFSCNLFMFCILSEIATETFALAPVGSRCQQDSECFENLICISEKCKCKPRYIQNGIFCFEEAYYGQVCWFDEQCIDHRHICSNATDGPRRCICDMYHDYNETISQCSPKANLTSLLEEKYNTFDELSHRSKKTFYGILVIGLVVTGIGMFCCVAASVYCCKMHTSDKKLEKDVNALILKKGGNPATFSPQRTESDRKRRLNDAAIDSMIETDMILA